MIDWEAEVAQRSTRLSPEDARTLEARVRAYQRKAERQLRWAMGMSVAAFVVMLLGLMALAAWPLR